MAKFNGTDGNDVGRVAKIDSFTWKQSVLKVVDASLSKGEFYIGVKADGSDHIIYNT